MIGEGTNLRKMEKNTLLFKKWIFSKSQSVRGDYRRNYISGDFSVRET